MVYTATPAVALTIGGAALASLGGSMLVNGIPAALTDQHGPSGPAAVTEANALAASMGIVSPLVIGGAVALGAGWRSGLLLVVPLSALLWLLGRHVRIPAPLPPPRSTDVGARLPARYWLAWAMIACCVAVEFCVNLWAGDVLHEHAGLDAAASSAGLAAVFGGMTVGRLVGSRMALRVALEPILAAAIALALVGFAVFWLATSPLPALIGLVVIGLGIALQYPLGLAVAVRESLGQPDRATARVGVGIAVAVGVGPFALGAVADRTSTHAAFLIVPLLLVAAATLLAAVRRPSPSP